MTGPAVDIDGVSYLVNFQPSSNAFLVVEDQKKLNSALPSSQAAISSPSRDDATASINSLDLSHDDEIVHEKKKKKSKLLLLPSKLKKKLKNSSKKSRSNSNKKKKKSRFWSSKSQSSSSYEQPSRSLIAKWKAMNHKKYLEELESSGSLFTGRLDVDNVDDENHKMAHLQTIQESCELRPSSPLPKSTMNEVVEEKKKIKRKGLKRLKRFFSKLNKKRDCDETCSTSSPRSIVDESSVHYESDAEYGDDSHSATAELTMTTESVSNQSHFSIDEQQQQQETNMPLPASSALLPPAIRRYETLPPCLTLARPNVSINRVARQTREEAETVAEEDTSPVVEEKQQEQQFSIIVSPVPTPPRDGSPRKKVLEYRRKKDADTTSSSSKKSCKKATNLVVTEKSEDETIPTDVAEVQQVSKKEGMMRWNVLAQLLVVAATAVIGAVYVWQRLCVLPRTVPIVQEAAITDLANGSGVDGILSFESTTFNLDLWQDLDFGVDLVLPNLSL